MCAPLAGGGRSENARVDAFARPPPPPLSTWTRRRRRTRRSIRSMRFRARAGRGPVAWNFCASGRAAPVRGPRVRGRAARCRLTRGAGSHGRCVEGGRRDEFAGQAHDFSEPSRTRHRRFSCLLSPTPCPEPSHRRRKRARGKGSGSRAVGRVVAIHEDAHERHVVAFAAPRVATSTCAATASAADAASGAASSKEATWRLLA